MNEDTTYGEYLRKLRTDRGLRLKDIADEVKCTVAYVSDIERGTRAPFCDEDVITIAKFLKVDSLAMLEVAHRSKNRFVLEGKHLSADKRELAAKLVDAWDDMDDDTARELLAVIE